MVCYVIFLSATLPDTMDRSPARWIALIHQLHIAGEEGGSTTMVAVFLPVLVCCGWLSHLFELVVCRKMVQKKLKEEPARCYLVFHIGVHHTSNRW
jgi:hypothetical protein